jgi:hypothetical protein
MKKIILFHLLAFISLSGCNKSPLCQVKSGNEGIIIDIYTKHEDCIYSKKNEFLIRNDSELASILYVEKTFPICDSVSLPKIDFNQYSLIGLRAGTNGGGSFLRTATRNDAEKKIYYEVYPNTCSFDEVGRSSYNMVLIPKVPDNYTIEYKIRKD